MRDRAQSVVLGSVLIFGIVVVAFSLWQAEIVPEQNSEIEFDHTQDVHDDLSQLRSTSLAVSDGSQIRSTDVQLGVRYPARLIAVNPPPVYGTLETGEPREIVISGAGQNRWWNGTDRSYVTREIIYDAQYQVLSEQPEVRISHGVIYDLYDDGSLSRSDQPIINGNQISLVVVNGSLSETQIGSVGVDVRPIHTQTETRIVEGNLSLSLPTQLGIDEWRSLLEDEPRVRSVTPTDTGIQIDLRQGTYRLSLSKIGVGDNVSTDPAVYVDSPQTSYTVERGDTIDIPVDTLNRYNDRVNATVTATQLGSQTTGVDGRTTFEYTGGSIGTEQISFTVQSGRTLTVNVTTISGTTQYQIDSVDVQDLGNEFEVTIGVSTDDPDAEILVESVKNNGQVVTSTQVPAGDQTISLDKQGNSAKTIRITFLDGSGGQRSTIEVDV